MKLSTAVLLVLGIVALLVANSADFFFRTPFYETWDTAANALCVVHAKHFEQLYGPYSRWGFYHPGPALFYIQALGEWLFFDWLHLTPAPFNAQTLLYVLVSAGLFVGVLRTFTRVMPSARERWWFLCAALIMAAWHFTAASTVPSYDAVLTPNAFASMWSAHVLVMPFLCLLTAGASVASGEGKDLPLLALAAGLLLQTHVAQPLFVFPLTALAIVGLVWQCIREERYTGANLPLSGRWRALHGMSAPWRRYRGEVIWAGILLGFLALPVLIDLCKGSQSNLAAILRHLRVHHAEHKTWGRSFCYFLQFGAYAPYQPQSLEFAKFDRAGMLAYAWFHWLVYACWLGVLLTALSALIAAGATSAADPLEAGLPGAGRRKRFLAWAAVFLAAGIGLTLKWGTMQDGQMFYYNAWFNFAIYYFGALIALVVVSGRVLAFVRRRVQPREVAVGGRERLIWAGAVVLTCVVLSGKLRIHDADPASTLAFHESVTQALAETAAPAGQPQPPRFLTFNVHLWVTAVGMALQMERAGLGWYVPDGWQVYFGGKDHAWSAAPPQVASGPGLQAWRFEYLPTLETLAAVRALTQTGGEAAKLLRIVTPTLDHRSAGLGDFLYVRLGTPPVEPSRTGGTSIRFTTDGNAAEYILAGWSGPEVGGTWSDSRRGLVQFRASPVPPDHDVLMTLEKMHPLLAPPAGLKEQRLQITLNGHPVGDARLVDNVEALKFTVPGVKWNELAAGGKIPVRMECVYPDAASPASLNATGLGDQRLLGITWSGINFQTVPAPGRE